MLSKEHQMKKLKTSPWALIPARGGSKSIPRKNLVKLSGRPLIEYGIYAALRSKCFDRIICSSDDDEIISVALKLGIEIDRRPVELASDDAAVADVARDLLNRNESEPEILVLVQPTSPFILPEHISGLIKAMRKDHTCNSGQTITPVQHNTHAWNQRFFDAGRTGFIFADERTKAFNKQLKPKYFCFGNLVAVKPHALLEGEDFFSQPSVGLQIEWPYNFDLDVPVDLRLAEAIIKSGIVNFINL